MKFIIDGDGTVSQAAALDLLTDISRPYPCSVFITDYYFSKSDSPVTRVLNLFEDAGYRNHNLAPSLTNELDYGDAIFIVVDAATRPELVEYCLDNSITVLDLTKGLYPVTEKIQ